MPEVREPVGGRVRTAVARLVRVPRLRLPVAQALLTDLWRTRGGWGNVEEPVDNQQRRYRQGIASSVLSARALNWAWNQSPQTTTEKLVLAALADRADDDGECFPSQSWIAAKCAPVTVQTIKRALTGLSKQGFLRKVERRRRGDGTLGTWLYQLALVPDGHSSPVTPSPQVTGDPTRTERPLREEANASSPKQKSVKPDKRKRKPRAPRPPDPIWDALVEVLRTEPSTKSERGRWNVAVAELREAGATPEQIHVRARAYRREWPNVTLTTTALAANWGLLAEPTRSVVQVERCPECGIGGGQHMADCSRAKR